MKHRIRCAAARALLRAGSAMLLLALPFSLIALAEGDGYTMALKAAPEQVAPGETVQLTVQVRNNGWPQSGDAEAAAFQAKLEYDRGSLEYVGVEIPEGTMGDFSPESGLVLGYGEGHAFQESLDCAVITMKVAEGASGEIPVTLRDPILARQNATELPVSAGGTLVLQVGGTADGQEPAVAAPAGGSAAGSGSSSGTLAGNGAAGSAAPAGDSGAPSPETAGAQASAAVSGGGGSTRGSGAQAAPPAEEGGRPAADAAAPQGTEGTADAPASAGEQAGSRPAPEEAALYEEVPQPGFRLLWGLVPLAAAALAGVLLWRRRCG